VSGGEKSPGKALGSLRRRGRRTTIQGGERGGPRGISKDLVLWTPHRRGGGRDWRFATLIQQKKRREKGTPNPPFLEEKIQSAVAGKKGRGRLPRTRGGGKRKRRKLPKRRTSLRVVWGEKVSSSRFLKRGERNSFQGKRKGLTLREARGESNQMEKKKRETSLKCIKRSLMPMKSSKKKRKLDSLSRGGESVVCGRVRR